MSVTARRYDIDNLRNIAVLLLIVFHTARLFDAEPWHMKDANVYAAAEVVIDVLNQWHMPLFFLLSGMSAFFAFRRRSPGEYARERVTRLLVPLLFGILIAVLPQVYLERISPDVPRRMSPIDFEGGFFAFVPEFFVPAYPEGNFSYHHLWFIWYLFLYSLLLTPVFALLTRPFAARVVERFGAWLAKGWRIGLLSLPFVAVELLLRPRFPSTHATIDDFANHAHFLLAILAGWLIAASPELTGAVTRLRRWSLLFAVVSIVIVVPAPEWTIVSGAAAMPVTRAIYVVGEWCWLLAFLGYGARYLDRPVPHLTAFTPYAFPFYIVHQAIIVWLGWLAFDWVAAPFAKFLVIAIMALVLSYAAVRLLALTGPTRFLIGLKWRPAPGKGTNGDSRVAMA